MQDFFHQQLEWSFWWVFCPEVSQLAPETLGVGRRFFPFWEGNGSILFRGKLLNFRWVSSFFCQILDDPNGYSKSWCMGSTQSTWYRTIHSLQWKHWRVSAIIVPGFFLVVNCKIANESTFDLCGPSSHCCPYWRISVTFAGLSGGTLPKWDRIRLESNCMQSDLQLIDSYVIWITNWFKRVIHLDVFAMT